MPNGDRGHAGAGAQAEGGAGRYVPEHGGLEVRTWRVGKLWTVAFLRLSTSALLSSRTWRHSCEYALLVFLLYLYYASSIYMFLFVESVVERIE